MLAFSALIAIPFEADAGIVIGEIMYNPPGGTDYEFVELYNNGSVSKDISGYEFTEGITYRFPEGSTLPSGGYAVIAGNPQQFMLRYGSRGAVLPDAYAKNLGDDGERLTLVSAAGATVFSVTYGDGSKWPGRADGHGASLMLVDPLDDPDSPENWCASDMLYGTPGESGICAVRDVVINEVLAHSDPPVEDAIEVQNLSSGPIDISGWYLSDDLDNRMKYRIPDGTVIQGYGGFRVFYEYQFNHPSNDFPFALSSANGDQVYLTAADSSGELTRFCDMVVFEPSENGISFGRFPDGTGALVTLADPTFGVPAPATLDEFRQGTGAANSFPRLGPVVVSEVMYHPPDIAGADNAADEYIELHNITGQPVRLYDPDYPSNTWKLISAVDFTIPAGVTIPGDGYLLIVGTADIPAFRATYGLDASVQIYGPWAGKLDNSGESIRLYKPDEPDLDVIPYILVDRVDYLDSHPWPAGPDGLGYGLERREPAGLGTDPANWQVSHPGGSPGEVNRTVPAPIPALFINEFVASNTSTCGTSQDWIELYNPGERWIDISGYYLTDDLDDPQRWQIPEGTGIGEGAFRLFYASGAGTGNHTNFGLSSSGEEIGLYSPEGVLIDSVIFPAQETNRSAGRQPDGYGAWFYFEEPTCDESNGEGVGQLITAPPDFSLPAGYYIEAQALILSSPVPEAVIRYTLDGSEPS